MRNTPEKKTRIDKGERSLEVADLNLSLHTACNRVVGSKADQVFFVNALVRSGLSNLLAANLTGINDLAHFEYAIAL